MDQITMETPTRLWIKVRLWIYEIDDMDIHRIINVCLNSHLKDYEISFIMG